MWLLAALWISANRKYFHKHREFYPARWSTQLSYTQSHQPFPSSIHSDPHPQRQHTAHILFHTHVTHALNMHPPPTQPCKTLSACTTTPVNATFHPHMDWHTTVHMIKVQLRTKCNGKYAEIEKLKACGSHNESQHMFAHSSRGERIPHG